MCVLNEKRCKIIILFNIYQQQEQKYMKLREDKMKYLQIIYPEIEEQCYDLIINGYKVQDKVIGKRSDRKNSYTISLYRNNGRINGKKIIDVIIKVIIIFIGFGMMILVYFML